MIALALAAVALAALLVAVLLPREAMAQSHALGRRADGTESPIRSGREAVHRRRALREGAVYPVLAVAALALAGVLADRYTPWTRLAVVFGTATSETALLSETQVERVRQDEARDRLMAEAAAHAAEEAGVTVNGGGDAPLAPAPGRGDGLGPFLMEHFPFRPLFVLLLGLALWRVYRHAAARHALYDAGVRARHREYHRYDLAPYTERARPADPPEA